MKSKILLINRTESTVKLPLRRQRLKDKGMNDSSWKLHFYQGPVPLVQKLPQLDDPLQDTECMLRFVLEVLWPSWTNDLHKVTNISEQAIVLTQMHSSGLYLITPSCSSHEYRRKVDNKQSCGSSVFTTILSCFFFQALFETFVHKGGWIPHSHL